MPILMASYLMLDIIRCMLEERYLKQGMVTLRWLPGFGALLMATIVVLGLLAGDEQTAENLLAFLVILPALPLMPAFHNLFYRDTPRLSTIALKMGYTSMTGITGLIFTAMVLQRHTGERFDVVWGLLFIGCMVCFMGWLVIVSATGIYTRKLPFFAALAGMIAGLSWLAFMSINIVLWLSDRVVFPLAQDELLHLINLMVPLWIGGIMIWSLWLSLQFLSGKIYRKAKLT